MIFDSVKKINLVEQIATQIKQSILKGLYKPGDRLPSERELAKILNVTRTTLREAIKKLEGLKLIIVRQGDGILVQDYYKSASLDILKDLLFTGDKIDVGVLQNILETRKIFGIEVVKLALQRKNEDEVKEYELIVEEIKKNITDPEKLQELDFQCFDLFAKMSKNIVFIFIITSIRGIYFENRKIFLSLYSDGKLILKMHSAILETMKGGREKNALNLLEEYFLYPIKIFENGEKYE